MTTIAQPNDADERVELLPAIQADQDAAVDLAHALGLDAVAFTSGAADVLVQHLARHRARASGEVERLREDIARLFDVAGDVHCDECGAPLLDLDETTTDEAETVALCAGHRDPSAPIYTYRLDAIRTMLNFRERSSPTTVEAGQVADTAIGALTSIANWEAMQDSGDVRLIREYASAILNEEFGVRITPRHHLSTPATDVPAGERAGVEGEVVGKQAAIQVALTTAPGLDAAYSRQAAWGYDQARQQIAANLAALPVAQEQPEAGGDYVLVPREPTEAMIAAGDDAGAGPQDLGDGLTRAIWSAMVTAAPASSQPTHAAQEQPATERASGEVERAAALKAVADMEKWAASLWRNSWRGNRFSDDGVTQAGAGQIASAIEKWSQALRAALGVTTHEG